MARPVQRVEFQPAEPGEVLVAMDSITKAGDGWINLLPGVDSDEAPPRPTGLSAVLAPRIPGAVMGTWAPQSPTRRGMQGATVGLLHPAGRFAARQLASLGAPVPEGWIDADRTTRDGASSSSHLSTQPKEKVLDLDRCRRHGAFDSRALGLLARRHLPAEDIPGAGLKPAVTSDEDAAIWLMSRVANSPWPLLRLRRFAATARWCVFAFRSACRLEPRRRPLGPEQGRAPEPQREANSGTGRPCDHVGGSENDVERTGDASPVDASGGTFVRSRERRTPECSGRIDLEPHRKCQRIVPPTTTGSNGMTDSISRPFSRH